MTTQLAVFALVVERLAAAAAAEALADSPERIEAIQSCTTWLVAVYYQRRSPLPSTVAAAEHGPGSKFEAEPVNRPLLCTDYQLHLAVAAAAAVVVVVANDAGGEWRSRYCTDVAAAGPLCSMVFEWTVALAATTWSRLEARAPLPFDDAAAAAE